MSSVAQRPPSDRNTPDRSSPAEIAMRVVAAVAILVGGLVHLELYFRGGYRSFPNANLGRSFVLNGAASVLVAALLLLRRDIIVRLAGIAVAVGTLIAFYLSRKTDKGIFGFTEQGFHPSPQSALAVIAEIVAVVVLVASFVPAMNWKYQSVINAKVASALAVAVIAVGIIGSVFWANNVATPTSSGSETTVAGAPAPGGQAISIKDFAFDPPSLSIKVGDAVTWTNNDGPGHSIKSGDHSFDSPDKIPSGSTFSFTFTTAGTFTYICGIHPSMKGTIEVAS